MSTAEASDVGEGEREKARGCALRWCTARSASRGCLRFGHEECAGGRWCERLSGCWCAALHFGFVRTA